MKGLLNRANKAAHHFFHRGHNVAHLTYFGAVFVEAHGMYGKVAAVLFVLTLLELFHFGGDA